MQMITIIDDIMNSSKFSMFQDGDYFTLPSTALLDDMTQIRDELLSERQKILGQKPSSSQVVPPSGASIGGASGGGAIGDRVAVGGAAAMPQIPMSDWAILVLSCNVFIIHVN